MAEPNGDSTIKYTNISDYDFECFSLVKSGWGSLSDIQQWDTTQFLDALEYENISNDIQQHCNQKGE